MSASVLFSSLPAQGAPEDDKRRVDRQLQQSAAELARANATAARAQKLLAEVAAQLPAAELAAAKARGAAAAAKVKRDIARQRLLPRSCSTTRPRRMWMRLSGSSTASSRTRTKAAESTRSPRCWTPRVP